MMCEDVNCIDIVLVRREVTDIDNNKQQTLLSVSQISNKFNGNLIVLRVSISCFQVLAWHIDTVTSELMQFMGSFRLLICASCLWHPDDCDQKVPDGVCKLCAAANAHVERQRLQMRRGVILACLTTTNSNSVPVRPDITRSSTSRNCIPLLAVSLLADRT